MTEKELLYRRLVTIYYLKERFHHGEERVGGWKGLRDDYYIAYRNNLDYILNNTPRELLIDFLKKWINGEINEYDSVFSRYVYEENQYNRPIKGSTYYEDSFCLQQIVSDLIYSLSPEEFMEVFDNSIDNVIYKDYMRDPEKTVVYYGVSPHPEMINEDIIKSLSEIDKKTIERMDTRRYLADYLEYYIKAIKNKTRKSTNNSTSMLENDDEIVKALSKSLDGIDRVPKDKLNDINLVRRIMKGIIEEREQRPKNNYSWENNGLFTYMDQETIKRMIEEDPNVLSLGLRSSKYNICHIPMELFEDDDIVKLCIRSGYNLVDFLSDEDLNDFELLKELTGDNMGLKAIVLDAYGNRFFPDENKPYERDRKTKFVKSKIGFPTGPNSITSSAL